MIRLAVDNTVALAWAAYDAAALELNAMYAKGDAFSAERRREAAERVAACWGKFRDAYLGRPAAPGSDDPRPAA